MLRPDDRFERTEIMRILVVDDHSLVRAGLKRLFDEEDDLHVVGEAADGREGARLADTLQPDLVLMDGAMPVCNGIEATRIIRHACPNVKVLALTRSDDAASIQAMFGAGAAGYVLKQNASAELIRAVRAIERGERYLDRNIESERPPASTGAPIVASADHGETISPQEEVVLRLVAAFYTNREIAIRLLRDVDDVADVKASVMRKLGLATRLQVIEYSERQGWREQPDRLHFAVARR
jgi:two-component system response regulator NreC